MITLRQLQRLWQSKLYNHLSHMLLASRPEASLRLDMELARPVPVVALMVIRLDELSQGHTPFSGQLIRTILSAQEVDGGWGDPIITALCLRALMCAAGQGVAIDRGIQYLANLQKSDGSWPREPLRRMPADAFTSAFILYQLADDSRFTDAVRMDEAIAWFESRTNDLDPDTARLWRSVSTRHGTRNAAMSWS